VEWSRRVEEMREHAAAVAELTAKLAALKTEVRNLDRQADKLREGIAVLRGEARRLATI
jgi:cell division protein FtsB